MRQVLFWIPTPWGEIPIYGYGMMLFVTFLVVLWLLGKRAVNEGIPKQAIQDTAVWIFIFGILGARVTYMIQYHDEVPLSHFFFIWEGGLVFYGSAFGGIVGYMLAYVFIIRKLHLKTWQLTDIMAPCIAVGLALGRIGCLLNGCCYGHIACADCQTAHFPLSAPARFTLTKAGYQTAAGFAMDDRDPTGLRVLAVEPDSPAALEGKLQPGDVITGVNGSPVDSYLKLETYMVRDWPRGQTELSLTVLRDGKPVKLEPFQPLTIGLHPTQLYETISMVFLFFLLISFQPFRRRYGEVMVLLMLCYAVHRFINETLRNDTKPVAFGMTLSENISIIIFTGGIVLWLYLWRFTPLLSATATAAPKLENGDAPEPEPTATTDAFQAGSPVSGSEAIKPA